MADIRGCSLQDRIVPGIGPIARFDSLSNNSACRKLYNNGTPDERDQLVQRFCNRFPNDDFPEIPSRCACYRFKDTPEFDKYNSLWNSLLDKDANGVAGDPLVGSYACFAKSCTGDDDVYKTTRLENTKCPDVVYCRQDIGSIDVDRKPIETKGKSLQDISIAIEQQCGKLNPNNKPDPTEPKEPNNANKKWWQSTGLIVLVIGVVLLILLALLFFRFGSK